jgi:hypothetical protein
MASKATLALKETPIFSFAHTHGKTLPPIGKNCLAVCPVFGVHNMIRLNCLVQISFLCHNATIYFRKSSEEAIKESEENGFVALTGLWFIADSES